MKMQTFLYLSYMFIFENTNGLQKGLTQCCTEGKKSECARNAGKDSNM